MENLSREELRIGNYILGSIYVDKEDAELDLRENYSEAAEWKLVIVEGIPHEFDECTVWTDDEYYRLKPFPLKDYHLRMFGFICEGDNGNYWMDLKTHGLQLIPSQGFWYPVYIDYGEMASDIEQHVSLKRVKYIHQLQNLFYVLEGKNLEFE